MPLPGQPPVPSPAAAPAAAMGAPSANAIPAPSANAIPAAKPPQMAQGNVAQALSLVRNALEMLQKALPMIPMGSPQHGDLLKAIGIISKHMEHDEGNKGVDLQSLLQMARGASQQSPVQAANRMFPAPTAAPAMPTPTPPTGA